jgi:hypothetical protein
MNDSTPTTPTTQPAPTTLPMTRVNLTLSSEVKEVFNAIQKKGKFSHNAMITKLVDTYLKYNDDKQAEIYRYCDNVLSGEIRDITLQFLNDLDLSDVPQIGTELRLLRKRVSTLESQMTQLLRCQNNTDSNTNSNSNSTFDFTDFILSHQDNESSTRVQETLVSTDLSNITSNITSNNLSNINVFDTDVSEVTLPSSIKTFSNRTLDSLIAYQLESVLGKTSEVFDYNYYIQHYSGLALSKDKMTKLAELVSEFNTELNLLLETHCDNIEMCRSFQLAGTVTTLQSYLSLRYKNELSQVWNDKISSLTLSELVVIIARLKPFKAEKSFIVSSNNIKSPQMAIKSVLNKNYDYIFKNVASFTTF